MTKRMTLVAAMGCLMAVACSDSESTPSSVTDAGPATDTGSGPDVDSGSNTDTASDSPPDTGGCTPMGPEVCSGGVDEDCDGLIDRADADCQGDTYYVAQTATGDGSGKDAANMMSVDKFNTLSGDYSNDLFYFSGSDISSAITPQIYGTAGHPVVFDGYEAGDCDPKSSYCSDAAHLSASARFILYNDNNYLVIKDFTFYPLTGFETDNGYGTSRSIEMGYGDAISGLELRNLAFGRSNPGSTVYLSIVEDFVIDNNYWYNYDNDDVGQNLVVEGGRRGRITNNKFKGGYTSYWTNIKRDSYEKVVIARNEFNDSNEEGLTFDSAPDGVNTTALREYDTVSSSTPTTVMLTHANWGGGDDPDYVSDGSFYMLFIGAEDGSGSLVGRHAKIIGQSDATLTLDTEGGLDFSTLSPGDRVIIGRVYRKNYIGHNTTVDISYGGAHILLYGLCFENLIEHNTITNPNTENGTAIEIRTIRGLRTWRDPQATHNGITQTCAVTPNAANLLRKNSHTNSQPGRESAVKAFAFDRGDCSPALVVYSYYNTFLDNILDASSNELEIERLYYQKGYMSGNRDSDGNPATTVMLSESTNDAAWKVYWPYIDGEMSIGSNGTTVIVPMSEETDLSNYSTGNAWIEDVAGRRIPLAYSSGDGTTSIEFGAISPVANGETWTFWFDGTDDSIQDSDGNDLPVYGFKPITNNSAQ